MSNIVLPRVDVEIFLAELKEILARPDFDVMRDLDILAKKSSEAPSDPRTTANTMLALDYDAYDVRDRLLELSTCEYLNTVFDNINPSLPPFFAFVKEINTQDVYIKAKIRDSKRGKIFCVSFHFAKFSVSHPLPYETT